MRGNRSGAAGPRRSGLTSGIGDFLGIVVAVDVFTVKNRPGLFPVPLPVSVSPYYFTVRGKNSSFVFNMSGAPRPAAACRDAVRVHEAVRVHVRNFRTTSGTHGVVLHRRRRMNRYFAVPCLYPAGIGLVGQRSRHAAPGHEKRRRGSQAYPRDARSQLLVAPCKKRVSRRLSN